MKEKKSDWENVDSSDKAAHYIYMMDSRNSLESVKHYTTMTYEMLELNTGSFVIDVGCGTGDDVVNLYKVVGPEGKVVGVDYSAKLIAEARKRINKTNIQAELHVGDAHNLTMFADNTFDAARATALFHHLERPEVALQEMIRIIKPEGIILIAEVDWEAFLIDHPNITLTRKIINYHCDRKVINGWIGRQLPRLFKRLGLEDIQIVPGNIFLNYQMLNLLTGLESVVTEMVGDYITQEEASQWLLDLQSLDNEKILFASIAGFVTKGKKPTV